MSDEAKKEIPAKFQPIVDLVDKMSVLDLSELVKTLEDHYGVSAAAPAMMMAAPAAGAAAAEEKTSFSVELTACGDAKINVIKAVREITGLGLKEAKDIVDAAPKMVKEGVDKATADDVKAKLEAAGATVTMK